MSSSSDSIVGNAVKLEVSKIPTSIHLWNGHWQSHFNCKKRNIIMYLGPIIPTPT
jgi:hypothetical protein